MSDDGQRVEFGDSGPYLFQVLDVEPQAMLLEEHGVCLLEFEELYLPIDLDVCREMAGALANITQVEMGPERKGMLPFEFELDETTELPLLTSSANECFQYNDIIFLDVMFDATQARMCFSLKTAGAIRDILSQVPA